MASCLQKKQRMYRPIPVIVTTLLGVLLSRHVIAQTDSLPATPVRTPEPVVIGIQEAVTDPKIATVTLRRSDLEATYPVIKLGEEEFLTLGFDDLNGGVDDYYYTFEHCNANWEPSGLSAFDYLDGFEENRIDDYAFSFGTLQRYTHYAFSFPDADLGFRLSGNYIVRVWRGDDRDTAVITRRFFIWEDGAAITGDVYRPNLIPYRNEYQEINFTLDIRQLDVMNAFEEIQVTVLQNGRFDNARTGIQPRMANNYSLSYDLDELVFEGAKEYRRFDTRTLQFQSDRIVRNEVRDGVYHSYINVEESRVFQRYVYEKDANGQFIVRADLANNVDTEADYGWVYFTLQYPYMITSGNVYAIGLGMPGGVLPMEYNFDKMLYHGKAYLKQGYYNYLYAVRSGNAGPFTAVYTEGNTYETENDYIVLVYQHVFDRDYDKLIGYTILNTIK